MSSMKLVRPLTTADGTPIFLRHPKTRVPLGAAGTPVDFADHEVAMFFKRREAEGDVEILTTADGGVTWTAGPGAASAKQAAKSTAPAKNAKGAE